VHVSDRSVAAYIWDGDWLAGRGLAQILDQVLDQDGAGGDVAVDGDVNTVAGGEGDGTG